MLNWARDRFRALCDGARAHSRGDAETLADLAPEIGDLVVEVAQLRQRYAYARDGEVTVSGLASLWSAVDALEAQLARRSR